MKHFDKIDELIRRAEYASALNQLNNLTKSPEDRYSAIGKRAWLYRSLGQYEKAIADYRLMQQAEPDDLEIAALLAETLLIAGDAKNAVGIALDVINRDVMNATAIKVLADHQRLTGKTARQHERYFDFEQYSKNSSLNPVADKIEQDAKVNFASVNPEIGRFLYWLVRFYRPKMIIETGSYIGYSALCMGQALKDLNRGHLHSFDIFVDLPNYKSPILGECADSLEICRGHIEQAGLADHVTFYKGDSSTQIKTQFTKQKISVDLAFIDGDHSLTGCLKDWFAIDELLIEGGLVLVHDTMTLGVKGWLGPRYLIEELSTRASDLYSWVNLPTPEKSGLAIIQKNSNKGTPLWWPNIAERYKDWFYRKINWGLRG